MKDSLSNYYCNLVKINLKRLKNERKWSITKIALVLGLSESYLGHLLSLKSPKTPSIQLLGAFCERANVPITYFFEEKNSPIN